MTARTRSRNAEESVKEFEMTRGPKPDLRLPRPDPMLAADHLPVRDVPAAVWLGLPTAIILLRLLSPLLGYEKWAKLMADEYGVVELFTVALLIPGIVISGLIVRRRRLLPATVTLTMALGGLCVLYFLGEEISWGQHYFRYATPKSVAIVNTQGEFNLHNLDLEVDIFDNIPRQLMLVATAVGGIILPVLWRKRLERPDAHLALDYWIIPNYRLIPIALLAVLSNVPQKISGVSSETHEDKSYWSMVLIHDIGETKELAFAGVMMLFLLSVLLRLRSLSATGAINSACRESRDS